MSSRTVLKYNLRYHSARALCAWRAGEYHVRWLSPPAERARQPDSALTRDCRNCSCWLPHRLACCCFRSCCCHRPARISPRPSRHSRCRSFAGGGTIHVRRMQRATSRRRRLFPQPRRAHSLARFQAGSFEPKPPPSLTPSPLVTPSSHPLRPTSQPRTTRSRSAPRAGLRRLRRPRDAGRGAWGPDLPPGGRHGL